MAASSKPISAMHISLTRHSFAPLDLPQSHTVSQFLELFRLLSVPHEFVKERLQSVSHSFGTRTDSGGSCSWFHFLCKNIDIRINQGGGTWEVHNRQAELMSQESLPQADYSYHRSGFFLRSKPKESVTLVCFGATPKVCDRLKAFANAGCWEDVLAEPHCLFDMVLEGLFQEVDATVWNMNHVFGDMEHVSGPDAVAEMEVDNRRKSCRMQKIRLLENSGSTRSSTSVGFTTARSTSSTSGRLSSPASLRSSTWRCSSGSRRRTIRTSCASSAS
jgi:hypothetical protein